MVLLYDERRGSYLTAAAERASADGAHSVARPHFCNASVGSPTWTFVVYVLGSALHLMVE